MNIPTFATSGMQTRENESNHALSQWRAGALPSSWGFSNEGNCGATTAEQKCYIRTLEHLLKANGAIISEDQNGMLCNP
jgi:hypothetical protein